MSVWGYLTAEFTLAELESGARLNELGKESWELIFMDRLAAPGPVKKINALGQGAKWLAVFKRPIA